MTVRRTPLHQAARWIFAPMRLPIGKESPGTTRHQAGETEEPETGGPERDLSRPPWSPCLREIARDARAVPSGSYPEVAGSNPAPITSATLWMRASRR